MYIVYTIVLLILTMIKSLKVQTKFNEPKNFYKTNFRWLKQRLKLIKSKSVF